MNNYRHLLTPLLSLIILTVGSALLTTFLALELHSFKVNDFFIGGLSTAYYFGMVIGAFKLEPLILRVGHIRAYSASASVLAVISLLHGFYINVYFWLLLRFIGGVATACLYIVIESWILSTTDNSKRGSALALYMVALYLAQACGQWLLNIGHHNTLFLYGVCAIFASLSVVPLSLTKSNIPVFSEPETFSIKHMISISPSGVTTCFLSGMILGSIYGLYPIFIQKLGYGTGDISTIMGVTILGGMLFQYPIGRLSDFINRRNIIATLSLVIIILCASIIYVGHQNFIAMIILSLLLGGGTFCLYPIGISHACDRVNNNQIVSATQTLLLAYGTGATLGPLLAPLSNIIFQIYGILVFIILMSLPLCLFILWRKQVVPSVPTEEKVDFIVGADMTPVASELNPRVDE